MNKTETFWNIFGAVIAFMAITVYALIEKIYKYWIWLFLFLFIYSLTCGLINNANTRISITIN